MFGAVCKSSELAAHINAGRLTASAARKDHPLVYEEVAFATTTLMRKAVRKRRYGDKVRG